MHSRSALTVLLFLSSAVLAQGTKQWTQSRFDEFERGTTQNVAIQSDGHMQAAPVLKTIFTVPATYVWSIDTDKAGSAYVGTGGSSGGSQLLLVTAEGKSTTVAEFKELGVQAIKVLPDGSVLVATSPDGKLYRMAPGSSKPEILFDPVLSAEKPKYLWSIALDDHNNALIGTGAPAAIYRVPLGNSGNKPTLLFHSADQHIRCLLPGPNGVLYAGSDGTGIVYRITSEGKAFALYAAPRHEITALALDSSGNLYVAGIGDKRSPSLPALPVQGNAAVSITFLQPTSSLSASSNALVPEGSEIYRITPDGVPDRLLALKDDVVYALAFRQNKLIAATGNHGHIYQIDLAAPGRYADLAHVDASQATAMSATSIGIYIASSNGGKLLHLSDHAANDSSYMSDVFDAGIVSRWGRAEVRTASIDTKAPQIFFRSGNVENPRAGLGDLWSDWTLLAPDTPAAMTNARYFQWKAIFSDGTSLRSVTINYLPRNLPPQVSEIVIQSGARIAPAIAPTASPTIPVAFATAAAAPTIILPSTDPNVAPLNAQRDRTAITARWQAVDLNGDDLTFSVYYRDVHEHNWHLLKNKIPDHYLSFDSALLPDAEYELRVVASDGLAHTSVDALTGERTSSPFTVDTMPPMLGPLTATAEQSAIHAMLDARDNLSVISHAEYSVDAGPWQYMEPVGHLSDGLSVHYDLMAPVSSHTEPNARETLMGEHVLAIRVYDRYENVASTKTVVR